MSEMNKETTLPKIQLFYMFYVSLAFVVPMIHHKNLIGFVTFFSVVVFYFLTEFKNVVGESKSTKKKLLLDSFLVVVAGALSSLVSLLFVVGVVFLFIKVYSYVAPDSLN